MKKICIVTSTRAEYGLLKNLIRRFMADQTFDVKLVVTGTHLCQEYGFTYREIEEDKIQIAAKIDIIENNNNANTNVTASVMAQAIVNFTKYFEENRPAMLVLLGDRYETLAIAIAAMNTGIPIAHLHGGETTEGAIDECFRHSITKMSYLHFTSTEEYRKRVIQLGESPERVFNVGALGVENCLYEKLYSKEELEEILKFDLSVPYAIVTYHPVTLEPDKAENYLKPLLVALSRNSDINYIVTRANADEGGSAISAVLEQYVNTSTNAKSYASLGMKKYLSALKYAIMVIGNSSSGIIEAPSFHIPTVNIGNRQRGRIQAESVINCGDNEELIVEAIAKARTVEFNEQIRDIENPYEGCQTAEKIVSTIKKKLMQGNINLMKSFYDIESD